MAVSRPDVPMTTTCLGGAPSTVDGRPNDKQKDCLYFSLSKAVDGTELRSCFKARNQKRT
ncbi:hypothetical protein C0Q70_19828 [Pomacea canaliculata]|uniref:Uncharacterized protein n=1 Tax=Pomacea canaliculata TaxID=400727 RepID=A0A2T7NDU7_POMCA|nr:hypothetical protein C0Q70_19828 [Pomacea canaliculata]